MIASLPGFLGPSLADESLPSVSSTSARLEESVDFWTFAMAVLLPGNELPKLRLEHASRTRACPAGLMSRTDATLNDIGGFPKDLDSKEKGAIAGSLLHLEGAIREFTP